MSELQAMRDIKVGQATKKVKVGNKDAIIVWDKLCADGPKDSVTNQPLIDPETGEEYPGANDDMAGLLHEYLVKLRGMTNLTNSSSSVPRYGVLSLLAMKTPIFVYDHPRFKKITNTAFTDGRSVFIDADFMRKLTEQEQDTGGKNSGVMFLVLHELMHKLLCHVGRLRQFPPKIANIAEDLVINGKLIKGFPTLKPVQLLYEVGCGMKQAEADEYHSMSEEVVAEMLMRKEAKKKKQEQDKKKQEKKEKQKGGGGSQSDDNDEGQEGDDSDDNDGDNENGKKSSKPSKNSKKSSDKDENGKEKSKDGDKNGDEKDGEEEYSPIHHITPEELLEIMEQEGLESVKKALDLPDSDDVDGIGKMKQKDQLNITDAVQTAQSQAMNCNGQYPGKEISDAASLIIGDLDKGKLIWKLALKKLFQGDGQKIFYSDDEAAIPWFLDKATMGIDPFYIGSAIPKAPDESVLVLVDTSGSTSGGTLRKEFLQEALGIKRSMSSLGDSARKVFIYSADTQLLGDPVEITDANIEKLKHDGIPIFDGGGTCFLSCLNQALEKPIMKKEKIKAVVYFTDCYDSVPSREEFSKHLEAGIKVVFVTTPGLFNEKWNSMLTWAEVYCMEEGTVVDLGKDVNNVDKNTRKNRLK
jgi:predicted metal-dependent peptidase